MLRLGDVLLVTLQGDLHDGMASQLQQDLAETIVASRVTGVVIDISGVEIVDSFLGRVLAETAAQTELLAARTVVAGMRPAVAITLVELGLTFPELRTALNTEAALAMLAQPVVANRPGGEETVMDTAADVEARLPIRSDMDLAWVRQHVRQAATRVGFGLVDQTKLVTAASELARNTLVHGGGGVLKTTGVTAADGTPGLRLTFSDEVRHPGSGAGAQRRLHLGRRTGHGSGRVAAPGARLRGGQHPGCRHHRAGHLLGVPAGAAARGHVMPRVWHVPVHDATRVHDVRVAAEEAAGRAGLDEQRRAACALVATELATNLLKHAKAGEVVVDVVDPAVLPEGRPGRAVQITALDHGPGIADVAARSRTGSPPAARSARAWGRRRRIADAFGLHSVVGRGTVAVARVGPATAGLVPEEDPSRSSGCARAGSTCRSRARSCPGTPGRGCGPATG